MSRLLVFMLIASAFLSCNTTPAGNASTGAILEVKERCAVLYTPDGAKLQSLKSAFGEKSFPGIMKANLSAMAADSQYLAGRKIKIVRTSQPTIKFVKQNGEEIFINLKLQKYAWEIFLFDGISDPVKANLTDIQSSYAEAFGPGSR